MNLKDLRNTGKRTTTSRGALKGQKKTEQENSVVKLKKIRGRTTSKKAYQLVKDLTTVKLEKATNVQDHSGNASQKSDRY